MIKRLSLETACPLSQGSANSDELCFLFVWERFPRFTHKGSLDRKVQWALCQETWCLRFDRCLLVFHPRSLNMHRKLEKTIANNAVLQVDCLVIGKFTDPITYIKLPALKENTTQPARKCIGFPNIRIYVAQCTLYTVSFDRCTLTR